MGLDRPNQIDPVQEIRPCAQECCTGQNGYPIRRALIIGAAALEYWIIRLRASTDGDDCERGRPHTTGFTPGRAVTRSWKRAPRISKFRYWSNDEQAGDSSTTGSGSREAWASRAALATATSSVSEIS